MVALNPEFDFITNPTVNRLVYTKGFYNEISFSDHLINGKASGNVYLHEGIKFSFLNTIEIFNGNYSGAGYDYPLKTKGYTIRLDGIKKIFLDDYLPALKPFNFSFSRSVMPNINWVTDGSTVSGFQITYSF
ncbi:hypothetical protein EP331_07550 [bacterium]|nr:MAG: hypothetical protein EP331_07550 [bacterium]